MGYHTQACNSICTGCKRDNRKIATAKRSQSPGAKEVTAESLVLDESSSAVVTSEVRSAKEAVPSSAPLTAEVLSGGKRE